MTTQRITLFASLLLATAVCARAPGQEPFRGMTTEVVNVNGEDNLYHSQVLDKIKPYYIDVSDDFDMRSGELVDSVVDGWRNQFVPSLPNQPEGPLSTTPLPSGLSPADLSGRWMGLSNNFAVENGRVSRISNNGPTFATVPWVVEQGVGRFYLIEMDAAVAVGEEVSLGYFGDVQLGTAEDLNGEIGQLVLDIRRVDAQTLVWNVEWDMEGQRQQFTSQLVTSMDTTDETLRLQLGWEDLLDGNDNFDAWLETPDGNERLAFGNMLTAIDVQNFGFGLSGTESYVENVMAAVPEPASGLTLAIGLVSFIGLIRRKRNGSAI